jgi:NYN domain
MVVNLASHETITQQPRLVSIYWDYQNVKLTLDQAKLLLDFSKSKGRLIGKNVYYNSQCADQAAARHDIASLSFKCLDVPCPLKNSADNQLIADCLEDIQSNLSRDIVILVSGDGDFVKLVRNLQQLGKQVIIFAQIGNVKQKLKELADEFHFVDNLSDLIQNKTQPQSTNFESHLNYNEAIEYLIAAIKTALSQGKPTVFGYIDKLMRQICPKYQGISSICTSEGKKFQKFSQFVDAAVKDRKIKRQNQQLFLHELDRIAA